MTDRCIAKTNDTRTYNIKTGHNAPSIKGIRAEVALLWSCVLIVFDNPLTLEIHPSVTLRFFF